MFKSSIWKSDKTKFKVVFKLNFHATQVPQLKKKKTLTISLVPENVGKPTLRLEKAAVEDGSCSWGDPIYETVKFTRQSKTAKINEKIYYFIVSSGSSKSGFVGEASIDFSEFAEATVPLTISLPLAYSNHNAILHVTIEKMQAPDEQSKETCESENTKTNVKTEDRSLRQQMSNHDKDFHGNDNSYQTTSQIEDQNDISGLPTSSISSTIVDPSLEHNQQQEKQQSVPCKDKRENRIHRISSSDWSEDFASEESITISTNSPEEETLPEASDSFSEKERSKVFLLTRQTEVMEIELQSLRKQVLKESKKGQDFLEKIISLKEERDAFRDECEQLKSLQKITVKREDDSRSLIEEIREELNYERDLNANFQSQLQKTQNSNAELILVLRELEEELLEHKNKELLCKCKRNDDALEEDLLKHEITELCSEIELYKKDKEDLEIHIEQLNLKNDKLKRELEMQNKNLEKQIQDFEKDLEVERRAKMEQEERALQAEEALRKTKQNHANIAERLQEEFKKLSIDMASKFDENEKLAMSALLEADELRLQKSCLEEKLQKSDQDMEIIKDQYDTRIHELLTHIDLKCVEVEKMSNQIESEKKQHELITMEIKMLKNEIEKIGLEKMDILNNLEQEKKLSFERQEMKKSFVEKCNKEREDLERKIYLAENESRKLHKELDIIKDEKDTIESTLLSEVQSFKVQCDELKHSSSTEKAENETLRRQIIQLKNDLQKKECSVIASKKNNGRVTISDKSTISSRNNNISLFKDSEEVTDLKKKLKILQEQVKSEEAAAKNSSNLYIQKEKERKKSMEGELTELLTEVAALKERNKAMEGELMDMQDRYSEISLKFAEVEGERQKLVMTVRNLKSGKKN